MKIFVEQAALQKATSRVTSAVERRTTIPVLANVLLTASDDQLSITATDLDIEVVETLPARIEGQGAITVNAATLSEIARNAPAGAELAIEFNDVDPRAIVKFARSRYQLPILPAGDFPERKSVKGTSLTLDADALRRLLDHVHFAQSNEETRYYLNGTYLHIFADNGVTMLRTVATDGHRLVMDQTPCDQAGDMPGVIIPRKAVNEMRRILADTKDQVTLCVNAQGVQLMTPTGHLITKTVDGAFPDYHRVMPQDWKHDVEVDRGLLKEAIKRVSLITAEKARPIKMTITDGLLTLTVTNMDAGVASEEIEVTTDIEHFEVGFNAKYVLDVLDQSSADRMLLRVTDPASPARLDPLPGTKHAEHVINVLMPLRV